MTEAAEVTLPPPLYWSNLIVFQSNHSMPGQAPAGWPRAIPGRLPAWQQILPWRACSSQRRWELPAHWVNDMRVFVFIFGPDIFHHTLLLLYGNSQLHIGSSFHFESYFSSVRWHFGKAPGGHKL